MRRKATTKCSCWLVLLGILKFATCIPSRDQDPSTDSSSASPPYEMARPVTVGIDGYGKAVGRREGGIDVWHGIPYAAPPVGLLRFAPPEPPQPWSPTKLDASRFAPDCWQAIDPLLNPSSNEMSEDCLYLNIWTPAGHAARSRQGTFLSGQRLLPVMVWLHGGAFQQGGANRPEYDGRRLAEREIVVVTFNYRLGALGFLVSSSDQIYGNFGLMDQRAAIYWIHEHIESFGGDPQRVTLFGESAGAVMTGLHLMMEGAGTLFHKAIMQSNPLGYTFRSVVVADFIGEALKRKVDCRDLACLRAERVEEILGAQASLMGVPRSVGDFFTWGPTLTREAKLQLTLHRDGSLVSRLEEHRLPRLESGQQFVSEWRLNRETLEAKSGSARWSAVNVTQPLSSLHLIPHDIPVMIGSNKHEGEMFVHSAFPVSMAKPVYWMFVGALFRDSSSKILRHYRWLVDEVERAAEELAEKQINEEEAKQEYFENRDQLEREYQALLAMNATRKKARMYNFGKENDALKAVVNAWSTGGHMDDEVSFYSDEDDFSDDEDDQSVDNSSEGDSTSTTSRPGSYSWDRRNWFAHLEKKAQMVQHNRTNQSIFDKLFHSSQYTEELTSEEKAALKAEQKLLKKKEHLKAKALKDAAKVVVDYRPVMSRIIDDYLFRCPGWHYAQLLSENRHKKDVTDNVFVYRFSQPTHIPGFKECWGKSCHTSELPFVFQAMNVLRTNYSTLGPYAQLDAPSAPEYPYTEMLAAYRGAVEAADQQMLSSSQNDDDDHETLSSSGNHTFYPGSKAFQKILSHFFGDYFTVDADEELASDMADRWASFSKTGNPNFDGGTEEWRPWWNSNSESSRDDHKPIDYRLFWDQLEAEWTSDDEHDVNDEEYSDEPLQRRTWTTEERDMLMRRRVLKALAYEIAEEDHYRTELVRSQPEEQSIGDGSFLARTGLFGRYASDSSSSFSSTPLSRLYRNLQDQYDPNEIINMAQDMSLMGSGLLRGSSKARGPDTMLPELLDLSWPPRGRIIERDCTCDMWDRIRYRY